MNFTSNQHLINFIFKHKHNIEFVRTSLYADEQGKPHDEIVLLFYKRGFFEKILDFFFETSPVNNGISFAEYYKFSKFNPENIERFEIHGINSKNNVYGKPAEFLFKLFMKDSIYAD